MKLKLTLHTPGDLTATRNIQVTADATALTGDLAGALTGALSGHEPSTPMTLRVLSGRSGRSQDVAADVALVDSGIRSGAHVALAAAASARSASASGRTVAVLRVVSGPNAGQEYPLAEGVFSIGRSSSADIQLADGMVSKDHARIRVSDRVEVVDNRSANGILVGGVQVSRVVLRDGEVATLGSTDISAAMVAVTAEESTTSTDLLYNRSPRVLARPTDREVELPAPPKEPDPIAFPYLAMIAPLVMGAVMYVMTRNALSLIFVALSPILMVGNYIDQRFRTKRRHAAALAAFDSGLGHAEEELRSLHDADRSALHALHPQTQACVEAARDLTPLLWSRRSEHPEFLQVRLGKGAIPAPSVGSEVRPGGIPELATRAREVRAAYLLLDEAPIVADLRSVGGLGLAGERETLGALARAVVTQLVTLHSPAELVLTCLTSQAGRSRWSWVEWLPHTASAHSPLSGNHLSSDAGTGKELLAHLEEVVELRRAGSKQSTDRGPLGDAREKSIAPVLPSVVVVVDEPTVDRSRLVRVAEQGPDVGVYVVWVASSRAGLPGACRTYAEVTTAGGGAVGMVRHGRLVSGIQWEQLSSDAAIELARGLAPVIDAGAPVEDESDLPRSMSVVTLLGAEAVDSADAVLTRWRENRSLVDRSGGPPVPLDQPSTLRALVGHSGFEEFVLDLRTHGPHALVGGTTGAGKSEFLQAWVLGMAHAYSPDRVTFLFVDYKGGAAFAKCTELPHCVGIVTDLNTYLVRRALRSLRAELRYREHLLNAKGAKDLIELEKTGDPDCPPSLIIVVDEFAALVGEVPEFVDGVVDVAQRGRSLGLHLILATQRPAGVIKDNLRANTNLRVALRMADEHDSSDVLGDTMAAHFDPAIPGRAAAKMGPGRITAFQSAFPGARTPAKAAAPPIEVMELDFGVGKRWKMPERQVQGDSVDKDIERVVRSVAQAARLGKVPAPRKPWLDELASSYNLMALAPRMDTELVLGVMDDPDHQRQVTEYFRPDSDGNILYVGAGGSGKSTALRSLAAAATATPRGGVVHIYGLDFAGGGLSALEPLPTVGSIIPGDDEERVARLLRALSGLVEERSTAYSALRASTLTEYRVLANRPDEPRVLLLLDGFGTFRVDYEGSPLLAPLYGMFQRLLVEGRGVGVHVAMTADRPSVIPTSVGSAFQRKVVLRMTDEDGYMAMGVPRDVLTPVSPPGRSMQVDRPNELQLAILGEDSNVAAQAREIERFAQAAAARPGPRPEPIRSLPAVIPAATLPERIGSLPVLGVADIDLQPIGFDPTGAILVAGPAASGRTTAVRWLAESFHRWAADSYLVHICSRRSPLSHLDLWTSSTTGPEAAKEVIDKLRPYAELSAEESPSRLAIVIEGYPEFVSSMVEGPLSELVKLCRRNGHLLIAEGESTAWASPWPLVMEVRNARTGLLLQPDQMDGDNLLRTSLPRVRRADFPPGRGFWIKAGTATKVQIPVGD